MLDADFLNCRLPEGQSFTTIVKHKQIYVDKTDLIYKLALDRKPILLTRPRRFGKSTIVSTLEELFTHGVKPFVDADGNLKESYFKGLAIEKLWKDEGEYKVIHIDFSTFDTDTTAYICDVRPDLRNNDKTEVYAQFFNYNFCNFIKDIAFKFGVELSSNKITPTMLFEDLIKKLGENKVVFLVDEYDFPLTHIPNDLATSEHEAYLSKISMILKSFYSLIKSNSKYFRKIFVTGITRFKDVSMLTLGNTISDISLSIDFGTIVGFTRAELKKYFYDHLVMAVTLLQNKSEDQVTDSDIEALLDQLASWYDGYSFDENAQSHVFSTISVLNFFCNSNARTKFKNYWYELGGTPTILVNNCQKILDSDIDNAFKEDSEFWVSEDAFKYPSSYESMDPKVMLYQTGYLTLAKAIDTDVYLKFPNLEIRSSFAKLQYLYLFKKC